MQHIKTNRLNKSIIKNNKNFTNSIKLYRDVWFVSWSDLIVLTFVSYSLWVMQDHFVIYFSLGEKFIILIII